jgi:hypothetical protein
MIFHWKFILIIDVAQQEFIKNQKVVIHNFANNERPGLYRRDKHKNIYFASDTQEEQLLRATTINNILCVDEILYPVCEERKDSTLFSTNVVFINDTMIGEKDKKDAFCASGNV